MNTEIVPVSPAEPIGLYRAGVPWELKWLRPKPFTEAGEMVLGRNSGCYYYSPDNSVSGEHATIARDDRGVWFISNNSPNGTYVNGHRVERAELIPKTQIQTGRILWVVVSQLDEVPITAPTATRFLKEALRVHVVVDRAARWIGVTHKVINRVAKKMAASGRRKSSKPSSRNRSNRSRNRSSIQAAALMPLLALAAWQIQSDRETSQPPTPQGAASITSQHKTHSAASSQIRELRQPAAVEQRTPATMARAEVSSVHTKVRKEQSPAVPQGRLENSAVRATEILGTGQTPTKSRQIKDWWAPASAHGLIKLRTNSEL